MSTSLATGCSCKRCEANQPHEPVDEHMIARALFQLCGPTPPVRRWLKVYDAQRLPAKPSFGDFTRQPWESRPAKRAAA
jgi:hypothetical protein